MTTLNIIEKGQNKAGTIFAIAALANGNQVVWKLCSNYVRGHVDKTWRYVVPNPRMSYAESSKIAREGMAPTDAKILFSKRLKGTQKWVACIKTMGKPVFAIPAIKAITQWEQWCTVQAIEDGAKIV